MIDLTSLTIEKAHKHLLAGDFTALDLTEAYLKNIEAKNKELNAYLEVFDDVREQAKAADRLLDEFRKFPLVPLNKGGARVCEGGGCFSLTKGGRLGYSPMGSPMEGGLSKGVPNNPPAEDGSAPFIKGDSARAGVVSPLLGIPLAIKDNILIEGRRVSAASKILEGYRASYDGTAIKKLKEAGAVFLGRTNMDEFAMGSSTENSAYGVTKNPHDVSRVPGGSSGGSAAAVAANLALAALGSDTAGSVRQPASFCGVVGFKPTYGAVSRSGLIAMGSSLDVIGAITKTTEDAEIIFDCIKGKDPLDSTSIELPTTNYQQPTTRLTIGVPSGFVGDGVDADVLSNFRTTLAHLEKNGCTVREVSLPLLRYSLPAYYTIIPAEVSTNLARYDGVKYGTRDEGDTLLADYLATRRRFGAEARRRILLGTYVLSAGYTDAYYRKAVAARGMVRDEISDAFAGEDGVDVIATPTAPTPAFKLGEKAGDPLSMYLADIFTVIANIAGIPAISIPSGFVERDGRQLPVGFQLMAAHGHDSFLLKTSAMFVDALRPLWLPIQ